MEKLVTYKLLVQHNRRGLFVEDTKWDDDKADESRDEEDLPEDRTGGDHGSLLVTRVCLAPTVGEEPWLRTNIFESTCTIKGKVYRFVIDSGSCRNVVSKDACRKLGLRREDHPTPYKLSWLQGDSEIRVT